MATVAARQEKTIVSNEKMKQSTSLRPPVSWTAITLRIPRPGILSDKWRHLTVDPARGARLTDYSMPLPRLIPQRINELPDFVALAVDLLCGFLRQLPMDPQLLF